MNTSIRNSLVLARAFSVSVACIALGAGCGSTDASELGTPFTGDADRTVVVGDRKGAVFVTPDGSACLELGGGCVRPQEKCGEGARADVVVDSSGKVVEIVCYPPLAGGSAPLDAQGNVELGKDNKAVVGLDGVADGVDISGNVTSSGNNVTVFGQGPGLSVIGGDVVASGNNFSLRGVTVRGDVRISGNNATSVLCEVFGDVIVDGNNAVIAECTIYGRLTVIGNNAKLVANRVAGGIVNDGKETVCDGNVGFSDANGDRVVDATELSGTLSCGGGKK